MKKTTTTSHVVRQSETVTYCDLCGIENKARSSGLGENNWVEGTSEYDHRESVVQVYRLGPATYSPSYSTKFDVCPKCFETVLVPFLNKKVKLLAKTSKANPNDTTK